MASDDSLRQSQLSSSLSALKFGLIFSLPSLFSRENVRGGGKLLHFFQ